jgi:hypothetical protein
MTALCSSGCAATPRRAVSRAALPAGMLRRSFGNPGRIVPRD